MSVKVLNHVWEHSEQKAGALLVLLALADHAHDDGGGAYPTIATLARKARLSERAVHYTLKTLVKAQEITIQINGGPQRQNLYTVILQGANIAGCNPEPPEGAIHDTEGCNPVLGGTVNEPSLEPSMFNRPEWFQTLNEDPRWTGKNPDKYIVEIEKEFPNANLDLEAHGAYEWLQTKGGQKKKVLRGFWRNWLKNASRPGPGAVVSSGRPTRPSAGHSADELKDSIRESRGE